MLLSIHKINFSWVWRCSSEGQTRQGERQSEEETGSAQTGRQRWDRGCLRAWFRAGINQWDQGTWPIQGAWFSRRMKEEAILSLKAIIHAPFLEWRSAHSEMWPMVLLCMTLKHHDSSYWSSILIVGWLKHRLEQYQRSLCWPPARLKCSTYTF